MRGLRKPAPACYSVVANTLGVAPREVVFIDDREANVKAAQEAGMAGIHFRSAAQLEVELRALGVLA